MHSGMWVGVVLWSYVVVCNGCGDVTGCVVMWWCVGGFGNVTGYNDVTGCVIMWWCVGVVM